MINNRLKRYLLFMFSSSILLCSMAFSFEFDNKVMESLGFDNVDLDTFSGSNDRFTGKYLVDVNINDQTILYNSPIYFYTKNSDSHACFTDELLKRLPLKEELYSGVVKGNVQITDVGKCYDLESFDNEILVEFDGEWQKLDMKIPHAYVADYDSNWVSPNQRDYGVSGAFLDYSLFKNFNRSSNKYNYNIGNSFRSYGVVGANVGKFRFRSNYQYDSQKYSGNKLEWTQTYGFTDIPSWNAQAYAGELYSRTKVFESTRFKGVSLFSQESMMPNYLRGYAPQITGTASTNAIVTIKQYGSVIKTVQVPPGPFAIADLPSYLNGTVNVEIEENDGAIETYQVDISQVPFLTRKGGFRYYVNMGKLAPMGIGSGNIDTKFVSADGSYGLTNNISIFGGGIYTTNNEYQAINTGIGFNLEQFGALSFDVTHSDNKRKNAERMKGRSYRFNYAKRFASSTTLNIAGYRFSSRDYTTLNNYVNQKISNNRNLYLEKNRFSLSVSQGLPIWDISISATATRSSYWNRNKESFYDLSLHKMIRSGIFKRTSLSLSLSRNQNEYGKSNNQIALFVSIPINNYEERIQYNTRYDQQSKSVSQQGVYYADGFGGNYSVGASVYHRRDFSGSTDYSLNASYNKDTSYGRFMASGNYQSNQQSLIASFDGSVTVTKHGIATHPRVQDNGARLIVNGHVPDVDILGVNGSTNIYGLAGISNIPSYYRMTYLVDNDNLPDNLEVQDGVIELAANDGAIAYRSINAISGEKSLTTISFPDGGHPPFGAAVYRKNGNDQEIAIVAENGLTYLTGLNQQSEFEVRWSNNQSCRLPIESINPQNLDALTCYME